MKRLALLALALLLALPAPADARRRQSPAPTIQPATPPGAQVCCKICHKGKACGDSCIARWKTCHKGKGCACDD